MSSCNEDCLREIFLCLPAKSLVRFKSVCKNWYSIISSHQFSHLHTLHHRQTPPETSFLLRLQPETTDYFYLHGSKFIPYHFPSTLPNPIIRSYSNGLFLLNENESPLKLPHCYIYNPTTKQIKKIILTLNERFTVVMGLNLVFDPSKSLHYKIICLKAVQNKLSCSFFGGRWRFTQIEIYDSETNTWENFLNPFLVPPDVDFSSGIYWNNGIHWNNIFLDFDTNIIGLHPEFEYPLLHGNGNRNRRDAFKGNYVISNSYFHYIVQFPGEKTIAVFELQRDYSQWVLRHEIALDSDSEPVSILSFIRGVDEEEKDSMLILNESGKIMTYGFAEKSFKEVIDFEKESFYEENCLQFVSRYTFQFLETLVPFD